MREQLLGYLLGALDASEHEDVAARLRRDPELQAELQSLRERLSLFDNDDDEAPCAPPGLAVRTCQFIQRRMEAIEWQMRGAGSQWRLIDVAVAAGVVVAMCMLFFPAVLKSRFQAQILTCQDNLREIGMSLVDYSRANRGYFPRIPRSGPHAVAGSYAPQLVQSGRLADPIRVRCPGDKSPPLPLRQNPLTVTVQQLEEMAETELAVIQREMGGSYGYTLGYVENGEYHDVKNQGRATFAVMADAPSDLLSGSSSNHGAAGQNVLFEDMHVDFTSSPKLPARGDDLYFNDLGLPGAGRHADDSSIGKSATPVFPFEHGPAR